MADPRVAYLRDAAWFCETYGAFNMQWWGRFLDIGAMMQPPSEAPDGSRIDVLFSTDEMVLQLCLAASIIEAGDCPPLEIGGGFNG